MQSFVFPNKICAYSSAFATAIEISQYDIVTLVTAPDCTNIQNLTIENRNSLFGLHKHIYTCMYLPRKKFVHAHIDTL